VAIDRENETFEEMPTLFSLPFLIFRFASSLRSWLVEAANVDPDLRAMLRTRKTVEKLQNNSKL
jgi:hypothetical protein